MVEGDVDGSCFWIPAFTGMTTCSYPCFGKPDLLAVKFNKNGFFGLVDKLDFYPDIVVVAIGKAK